MRGVGKSARIEFFLDPNEGLLTSTSAGVVASGLLPPALLPVGAPKVRLGR